MDVDIIGIVLIALGIGTWVGIFLHHRFSSIRADRKGIAIGRDNKGIANTGTIGQPEIPGWERLLGVLGAVAGIVGLALYLLDSYA